MTGENERVRLRKQWTERDIYQLAHYYQNWQQYGEQWIAVCAEYLDRSPKAVWDECYRLGQHGVDPTQAYTLLTMGVTLRQIQTGDLAGVKIPSPCTTPPRTRFGGNGRDRKLPTVKQRVPLITPTTATGPVLVSGIVPTVPVPPGVTGSDTVHARVTAIERRLDSISGRIAEIQHHERMSRKLIEALYRELTGNEPAVVSFRVVDGTEKGG